MIINELANTTPMFLNFMATKKDVKVMGKRDVEAPVIDFCYCDYQCDYQEIAFGDTAGTERTNDKSSFLYKTLLSADTVTIKLLKNSVVIESIVDSSLGVFYPKGTVTGQPNYVGWVADWGLILDAHGSGLYTVETDVVIIGAASTISSHKFRLFPFNDIIADDTIKLVTIQNGNIMSSSLDYTGLNWMQSVRINGAFGNKQSGIEIDRYITTQRNVSQIQDEIKNTFTCETNLLPSFIGNLIIEDNLLANSFRIYNYGLFDYEIYNGIEVAPEEIEEGLFFSQNKRGKFIIKFSERKQNRIKRNNS